MDRAGRTVCGDRPVGGHGSGPPVSHLYRIAGVDSVIRVTDLMVNQLMMEVECPEVQRISTIGQGQASIFMVVVPDGGRVNGKSISDIGSDASFPTECVIAAVFTPAEKRFHIPRGSSILRSNDQVFLIADDDHVQRAIDFLTAR